MITALPFLVYCGHEVFSALPLCIGYTATTSQPSRRNPHVQLVILVPKTSTPHNYPHDDLRLIFSITSQNLWIRPARDMGLVTLWTAALVGKLERLDSHRERVLACERPHSSMNDIVTSTVSISLKMIRHLSHYCQHREVSSDNRILPGRSPRWLVASHEGGCLFAVSIEDSDTGRRLAWNPNICQIY